jgi:hypothetical protein
VWKKQGQCTQSENTINSYHFPAPNQSLKSI